MKKIKHHLTEQLLMGYSAGTLPEAGEAVPPGSEITIVLSDGPEDLILPSFIGEDKALAFIGLDELGLIAVEFGQFINDPSLVGKVVDTVPGPNSAVQPGQQIQVITGLLSPEAAAGGFDQDDGFGQGDGQGDDFEG